MLRCISPTFDLQWPNVKLVTGKETKAFLNQGFRYNYERSKTS